MRNQWTYLSPAPRPGSEGVASGSVFEKKDVREENLMIFCLIVKIFTFRSPFFPDFLVNFFPSLSPNKKLLLEQD